MAGVNGVVYLVLAGPLGELRGVRSGFLLAAGAFLLAFAAVVWLAGSAALPSARVVWAIIAVNAVWVVMQAAAVAAFALLQVAGLRRLARL